MLQRIDLEPSKSRQAVEPARLVTLRPVVGCNNKERTVGLVDKNKERTIRLVDSNKELAILSVGLKMGSVSKERTILSVDTNKELAMRLVGRKMGSVDNQVRSLLSVNNKPHMEDTNKEHKIRLAHSKAHSRERTQDYQEHTAPGLANLSLGRLLPYDNTIMILVTSMIV